MKESYFTSDFGLVCTLHALDFKIKNTQRNGRRLIFEFEGEGIDDMVEKYHAHELKIEPQKLWNSSREIKARIYN